MKQLKYITPEFFHNWLNDCPVKWERIEDNVDEISIKFFLPIEEEYDNNERESKFIDINNTGGKY